MYDPDYADPIRDKTLVMEYKLLQKFAPMGMFVLPNSFDCFLEWHGVYLVKQGIYNSSILKFKIVFSKGYPKVMPEVRFQSKVYHPLVNWETGKLNLNHEFKTWVFGKCWVINILLFIKKIFHLEDCFNLKKN